MLRQKIMIVDDNPDLAILLRDRVEIFGFKCEAWSSIHEALSQLEAFNPDLILLDLEFAQSTGTIFLKNIRDYISPAKTSPPVIVLNQRDQKQIYDYAFNLGTAPFHCKTYSPNQIHNIITDYLPTEESEEAVVGT